METRLNLENEARQSKYAEDSNLILCSMNSEMEQAAILSKKGNKFSFNSVACRLPWQSNAWHKERNLNVFWFFFAY